LRNIAPAELISEGRVYGGGLHKVEPRELAQIPARAILEGIDVHVSVERQESLFA
jgi:adenine-specific DNA-methyltransferase